MPPPPRVLIIAENASRRFGGEATLPLHLFRVLRSRGAAAWLITHERCRAELQAEFPNDDHLCFVAETRLDRILEKCAGVLPDRLATFTFRQLARFRTQRAAMRLARQLIRDEEIELIHQPVPVAPRDVSLVRKMGVPVVFGPFNGGMTFPPGFAPTDGLFAQMFITVGRAFSKLIHTLFPAKREAALLLVANQRTRNALPVEAGNRVRLLVENGVEMSVWKQPPPRSEKPAGQAAFAFVGRLVEWKAVDVLLNGFARVVNELPGVTLDIVGDGVSRASLETLAKSLGIEKNVTFHGWLKQTDAAGVLARADAFVLPSLYESGGAVVLEAMAVGLPVIATKWGGPCDYLDARSGILVEPTSRDALIAGFADAIRTLANAPARRVAMGQAGRQRVERDFDWERKVDHLLTLYREVIAVETPALVAAAT
ncbi:MAG: glycosyltransferase family 4 protein [Tepidisphaeraceae bacterium]